MEQCHEGRQEEFENLLLPHMNSLSRLVRARAKNRSEADDIVQDALLRAFLHLDQLRNKVYFKPWLFSIAINELRQKRRSEASSPIVVLASSTEDLQIADLRPRSDSSSILVTVLIGLVNVLLTIVSLRLFDRVGRRPLLLTGVAGMTLSLGILGLVFELGRNSSALGWLAVICVMVYVASFAISLGPIFWLLISEIYPLRIRSSAMALATMTNWGFNLLIALTFLTLVEQTGPAVTFWIYAVLSIACWIFSYYLVPENPSYIPANQKISSVDQWNVTIERQLSSSVNLSAAYVGNLGRHLNGGYNLNAAIPGPGSDINLRRPLFSEFGLVDPILDKCDCTSSNYNALQLRAEKRFGSSYSLLAAFTYSKTMEFGEFGTPTDQYNTRLDYGLASFDRNRVFTLAHTYTLPFGPGRKYFSNATGVARQLLNDWEFSGITSWESGLPFSATLSNSASLNSDQSLRPDQIGNPFAGTPQDRIQWFNPQAFPLPQLYLFGTAARNSLRGPVLFSADWGLAKTFELTERFKLQFRWDAFNSWNNTNLALPNSNVDTGNAGQITSIASPMRNMQYSLRLTW